jgi:L-fuculose-phosphate aldolase
MESISELSKDDLMRRAQQKMQTVFETPQWSLRQRLALTCRILFDGGHDSGLAGQITYRGERPRTFYTQQLGVGFDEITASNLLLVDEDLNVLEGKGMPNPANLFHSWLYRARPDVNCIIHTHAPYVSALSMLETPLVVAHMDTSVLFGDCAFLEKWPGVPVGNDEGRIISEALGNKRAILLAHHGQLVTGATVEEACTVARIFERAAHLQLVASAAGKIQEIPEDLGREAHDWLLSAKRVEVTFTYYARRALKRHSDCLN